MNIKEITRGYRVMKMHGSGNDFVVLPDLEERLSATQVQKICKRSYGVGSDGLIAVCKSRTPEADIRMKFFNPDGTTAEMCGNGIRCFTKYLADNKFVTENQKIAVDTDAGILYPEIIANDSHQAQIKVNMGIPQLENKAQCIESLSSEKKYIESTINGQTFIYVGMGNPHAICFSKTPKEDAASTGSTIEYHATYPQKTNVEFAKVLNRQEVEMHVWERGAGLTLACGTGACATFVAAFLTNQVDHSAVIKLPGGNLTIAWEGIGKPIFMTGDAVNVFEINPVSLDQYLS
jgi:diaminopimelate epimerase